MILDLGLPDATGQELLARWRAAGKTVPVVILSSRADEAGIVEALELGAGDYVTKPFGMRELIARLGTALRHRLQTEGEQAIFESGDLSVDLVRRIVRVGGARSASRPGVRHPPRDDPARRKGPDPPVPDPQVWGGAQTSTPPRPCARAPPEDRAGPTAADHIRTETARLPYHLPQ